MPLARAGSAPAVLAAAVLAAAVFAVGPARADPGGGDGSHAMVNNSINAVRIDVHADVDRYNMFGVGARAELPLVREGLFRGNVHDEVALSLGADLFFQPFDPGYYDGGAYLVPIVAVQWNFYFGSHWSLFPEGGVALHLGFDNNGYGDRAWLYAEPALGIGARFHFNDRVALLMRVSNPAGLQLGLVF